MNLALFFLSLLIFSSLNYNEIEFETFEDSLPNFIKDSQIIGELNDDNLIKIGIALKLRNKELLNLLLKENEIISNDLFNKFFSPKTSSIKKIKEYFISFNFKLIYESKDFSYLIFLAKTKDVEKAFYVNLLKYKYKGITFYSPNKLPILPKEIGKEIFSIVGLSNYTKLISDSNNIKTNKNEKFLVPLEIWKFYRIDKIYEKNINASNVTIGIISYGSFNPDDLKTFQEEFGIEENEIILTGDPASFGIKTIQTTIKVEWVSAIARNSKIILSLFSDPTDILSYFSAYETLIEENEADIIFTSWIASEDSWTRGAINLLSRLINEAVVKGITVVISSGSKGSNSSRNDNLGVFFPSSHPKVISVGGTSIINNEEIGWGGIKNGKTFGSGGGISKIFEKPDWQNALGIPNDIDKRILPDIAFHSDPKLGYAVYFNNSWISFGGTIFSSAIATGILSLIINSKGERIGNVNEILYSLAQNETYYNIIFNDIKNGTNGYYKAKKYWDFVTGIGSLKSDRLLNYISEKNLKLRINTNIINQNIFVNINNQTLKIPLEIVFKPLSNIKILFPLVIYKNNNNTKIVFTNITGYLNTTKNEINLVIYENIKLFVNYKIYHKLIINYPKILKINKTEWIEENENVRISSNYSYYLNKKERLNLIGYIINLNLTRPIFIETERKSNGTFSLETKIVSPLKITFIFIKQYKVLIVSNEDLINITESPTKDLWYDENTSLKIIANIELNKTNYFYKFKEWKGNIQTKNNTISFIINKSIELEPIYETYVNIKLKILDLKRREIIPELIILKNMNKTIEISVLSLYLLQNTKWNITKISWKGYDLVPLISQFNASIPQEIILIVNVDDIEIVVQDKKGNILANKEVLVKFKNGTSLVLFSDEKGKIFLKRVPSGGYAIIIEEEKEEDLSFIYILIAIILFVASIFLIYIIIKKKY